MYNHIYIVIYNIYIYIHTYRYLAPGLSQPINPARVKSTHPAVCQAAMDFTTLRAGDAVRPVRAVRLALAVPVTNKVGSPRDLLLLEHGNHRKTIGKQWFHGVL